MPKANDPPKPRAVRDARYYEAHRVAVRERQRLWYLQNRKRRAAQVRRKYWQAKIEAAKSQPRPTEVVG